MSQAASLKKERMENWKKGKKKGRSRDILYRERERERKGLWNRIKTGVTQSVEYISRAPQNSLFSLGPKWTETGKHSAAPPSPFFFVCSSSIGLVHFFPSSSLPTSSFFCILSFCFAARLKHLVRVSFKYQKEASDRQFSLFPSL